MPDRTLEIFELLRKLRKAREEVDRRTQAAEQEVDQMTPQQRAEWIRRINRGLIAAPGALVAAFRDHPATSSAIVAAVVIGGGAIGALQPWEEAPHVTPPPITQPSQPPPSAATPREPRPSPSGSTPSPTLPIEPIALQPSPSQPNGQSESKQPETRDQGREQNVKDVIKDIGESPVRAIEPAAPTPETPVPDVPACLLRLTVAGVELALLC